MPDNISNQASKESLIVSSPNIPPIPKEILPKTESTLIESNLPKETKEPKDVLVEKNIEIPKTPNIENKPIAAAKDDKIKGDVIAESISDKEAEAIIASGNLPAMENIVGSSIS